MKKSPLFFAALCVLINAEAKADTWLQQMSQPDKVGHYASGATLAAVGSVFINPEAGLALAVGAAIGKEAYDAKHPATHQVERNDALATILGGVLVYAAIKTESFRISYTPAGTPVLTAFWTIK